MKEENIKIFENKLRQILSKGNTNLIIFGETHGFLEDGIIQEKIIEIFKPDIFVYEMLEESKLETSQDQEIFLNEQDFKEFSVISTYGELKPTIRIARKNNIPIVGNDIKNMCRTDRDFLKRTELSNDEIKIEEEILSKRELKQMSVLKNLSNTKKILATTGAFHIRADSPLLEIQNNYLIVYPAYFGEQIFKPPENFDEKKVTIEVKEIVNDK